MTARPAPYDELSLAAAPIATVSTSQRIERYMPFLLAAIVLVVTMLTITPWPVGAFQDDAIYTVLAKSLAEGHGYRMINLPGMPHATHYPPAYPAFLALLWKFAPNFPDNIVLFKFANTFILALGALGIWYFARLRLRLSVWAAAASTLVGTISIVILLITGVILSEPMFMAALVPLLLYTERVADRGDVRGAALAGAGFGALAMVRSLGIFGLPAAALMLVWRRQWKAAIALCAAGAVVLLPWQLWVSAYQHELPHMFVGKYGSYGLWLADGYREGGIAFAKQVFLRNLSDVEGFIGFIVMPVQAIVPRTLTLATLLAVLIPGFVLLARRAPVTAWFIAVYVGIVMVWPFEPNRFVIVLWPLFACAFTLGVGAVWRWRPPVLALRVVRMMAFVGIAAALGGYGVYNYRGFSKQWWVSVQRDTAIRAKGLAEWVTHHTAMDDVLSTDDDLIIYLYTGRLAMPTATFTARERVRPNTTEYDAAVLREMLRTYKLRYYIAASAQGIRAATVLLHATPPELRLAGSTQHALIYEPLAK